MSAPRALTFDESLASMHWTAILDLRDNAINWQKYSQLGRTDCPRYPVD